MGHLTLGLFLAIVAAGFLWVALSFHFFRLKSLPPLKMSLRYPLVGVVGYLLLFFIIAPISVRLMGNVLQELAHHRPALLMTLLQTVSLCWVIGYLLILWLIQDKETRLALWIHPQRKHLVCVLEDFGLGILTWVLAFPLVGAVSQIIEFLTHVLTGFVPVDQLAVRYLKLAKESPFLLAIALFAILIAAPVIEELVFRGFLYTYLKKRLSLLPALVLSAAIFALFHFSPQQGLSNFSLLVSLFTLALFLGFLYERQRSLFAPIALHMTFNSISVIRILWFNQ
ncbi:MAG: CPBP family intramembrane metalloprotease [Chlamydiia bacterium]|nr:CPBP family intramembrane metalloprotease [Chlamydiia bacterium]